MTKALTSSTVAPSAQKHYTPEPSTTRVHGVITRSTIRLHPSLIDPQVIATMSSNKRGNIFGQGKPEQPYEERDDPAEVPQRATAAQLAARK
jgi:hypothetical protein